MSRPPLISLLLGPCLRVLLLLVSCAVLAPAAFAQGGDAQDLALQALRLEFERDNVAATAEELNRRFREACEGGYNPACRRSTWQADGEVDANRVREIFLPSCEAGDPVACLVTSYALDAMARTERLDDDKGKLWRKSASILKTSCDRRFAPACHEFAWHIFEGKGLALSDPVKPALKEWNKACDAREWAACTQLARVYRDGGPVKSNAKAARKYAQMACRANYPDACYVLGRMDDSGWTGAQMDTFYGGLCERGHKLGCWRLARAYYDGIHPEPAQGRIQGLFERGCALDHAQACFEAGRWEQDLPNGDDARAAPLFGRACELEYAAGCSAQVDMILAGRVEGSVRSAFNAFDLACEQRQSVEACTELGYHLLDNESAERDPARGRELLGRVCTSDASDPEACFVLGRTHEEGIGGDRDRTDASTFYRWACKSGYIEACIRRGELLISDVGVRRDDQEALVMFGQACDGQLARGCAQAGQILEEGTYVRKNNAAAAEWYGKGCEQDHPDSCRGLGRVHEEGVDGQRDLHAARAAQQKAVDLGSLDAKRDLSRLLWNGMGGPRKRGAAKKLAREACQAGDAVACRGPNFLK
ncbi:MAG: sel1 repeat family protein [Myxococcales bacterium]|nr:sel1 repeat family protein [Myxococcales bacterium]